MLHGIYRIISLPLTAVGLEPWQELLAQRSNWPTGYVVRNTVGLVGLVILGIAMFCAVVSGMNAFYISTSRLMYAMAVEGSLPKWFGRKVLHSTRTRPQASHRTRAWLHKQVATAVKAVPKDQPLVCGM